MDPLLLTGILAAGIRLGMAIGLSAIGELASERSGIFNIGIEGIMLSAAFVAAWGSVRTGSPWLGIVFAMVIGLLLASFHALMVLVLGVNQFIGGIGMVIFGFGFSSFAARLTIGAKPTSIPGLPRIDLGALTNIPVVGPIFFGQSPLAYIALALALATGWLINRTALGLEIRACGESAGVARRACYSGQGETDGLYSIRRTYRRPWRRLFVRSAGACVR